MAEILCPLCGKPNPDTLENCQFCGVLLLSSTDSSTDSSESIRPGEKPVKKNTAEFDKVKLTPSDKEPIHPGDAPTKKNTAELERTLPSWLRTLRAKDESAPAEPSPDQGQPSAAGSMPSAGPSDEGQADWLSGLGAHASDDEEVPDWLMDLRGSSGSVSGSEFPPAAASEPGEPAFAPGPEEGGEAQPAAFTPQDEAQPPAGQAVPPQAGEQGLPDWIEGLQSGGAAPSQENPAGARDTGGLTEWLSNLPPAAAEEPAPAPAEEVPDWLSKLKEKAAEPPPASQPFVTPVEAEATPDWLAGIQAEAAAQSAPQAAGPASELPDWLGRLKEDAGESQPSQPAAPASKTGAPAAAEPGGATPDWLNSLKDETAGAQPSEPPASQTESTPAWPADVPASGEPAAASPFDEVPDWLSKLETQAGTGASAPVPSAFPGEPSQAPAGTDSPDWLSKLQADASAGAAAEASQEQFDVAPGSVPPATPADSLPDWLASIDRSAAPSSGTPALIADTGEKGPSGEAEAAFSVETPDWLSKLSPDQAAQGKSPAGGEGEQPPDSLRPADLPSWVQAMRPVEAVVAEANALPANENQEVEAQGPLAGLRGVLPSSPGLGSLRKPPAYSVKLQATDTQQRYAAHLEKLISAETESQGAKRARPMSGALLRGIITLALILALGLPIATGLQLTPVNALYPPEMLAMTDLINALPPNSPVLVVFDYEPALSGELEATAAPVIDHLLIGGARLTFVSTSPTGPALAERFMAETQASHNYKSGQQYVNLGYLAGGSVGVLNFVEDPSGTASFAYSEDPAVNGQPAWTLPPLAGIQALSDFNLVLVLTDNADTGRVWIEQAGPVLRDKSMAMVISAQAEPMIRPYYDSGQIKGLVTGLAGGKAYEQYTQRPGLGGKYWNAFSAGLLLVEILIVLGGVWGVLDRLRGRKAGSGKES